MVSKKVRLAMVKSLLALVSLLTLVTPASAECAWVLWYTWGGDTVAQSSTITVSGHSTKEQCDQAMAEKHPVMVTNYRKENPRSLAYLICLPDTIDPRGPKGKW